jgi:hypothetical protein
MTTPLSTATPQSAMKPTAAGIGAVFVVRLPA